VILSSAEPQHAVKGRGAQRTPPSLLTSRTLLACLCMSLPLGHGCSASLAQIPAYAPDAVERT